MNTINNNINMNNTNNINSINNQTLNNNTNNLNIFSYINYNNMESLYETNNLNCIKLLLNNKFTDRLIAQYGKMMTKVIEFERITCIIEIFNLYHGNFVYYDPIKNINDYLSDGEQNTFDIRSIKDHIYEDILGYNLKKDNRGRKDRRKSIRRNSIMSEARRKKSISFNIANNSKNSNIINNKNSNNTNNINSNSENSTNENNNDNDNKKNDNNSSDNIIDENNFNNNDDNGNDTDNEIVNNNSNSYDINQNLPLSNDIKENINIDNNIEIKNSSKSSSSNTIFSEVNIPVNNNDNEHLSNKYMVEKNERLSILKNIEESIYRSITEVYNETKLDNKPYRPYQINFFCFCILKLVDIYRLLDKNRRAVNLLLSLSDFINKKVNAISDYLDSIKVEDNNNSRESINNLIEKKIYEERLLVDIHSGSALWLEVKKQTALNALVICDYNYAIITSKSGLKDAATCKSSNYKLEFLKIIICSKIRLHSKNVKKYVNRFEEILKSQNLALKSKFEGYIFYIDVTSKLNIYTTEEILNNRNEDLEKYFYDLMIPQSLILEDVHKMTKYSPYYTDYVIFLYQQAVLYKSIHQYDLSLKYLRCAINIMKYFVNISSFICLPILNKYYHLLMLKENDISTLKTVDSVCRTIIDFCIQEGGYNVRALKNGFSGLFICSIKVNEIYEAFNYLYSLSIIGTIISNIRLLNVNTDVKAQIMEHVIKSKTLQNEVRLWYAKENQLYDSYDIIYSPLDISTIKSRTDVKNHIHLKLPDADESKINEKIYLYYKYLFFDTNILDNIAFDYYSCSKMSRLQRTHQILLNELPEDVLSHISISRLLNLNHTTDSKYITKFENMWMAQWF
eukprot:jgi/Orpsp1_1/1179037/evm.model.c7180000067678.1